MTISPLLQEIANNLKDAVIGGIGGLVAYLYHYSKNKSADPSITMDIAAFTINGIVGAFMSYCFGGAIPTDLAYRDGVVGIIGGVGFGLMGLIESKFISLFLKKFLK